MQSHKIQERWGEAIQMYREGETLNHILKKFKRSRAWFFQVFAKYPPEIQDKIREERKMNQEDIRLYHLETALPDGKDPDKEYRANVEQSLTDNL